MRQLIHALDEVLEHYPERKVEIQEKLAEVFALCGGPYDDPENANKEAKKLLDTAFHINRRNLTVKGPVLGKEFDIVVSGDPSDYAEDFLREWLGDRPEPEAELAIERTVDEFDNKYGAGAFLETAESNIREEIEQLIRDFAVAQFANVGLDI